MLIKRVKIFLNQHLLLLLILFIALLMRGQNITQAFIDAFSWRQASTAMMAENFFKNSWNIFALYKLVLLVWDKKHAFISVNALKDLRKQGAQWFGIVNNHYKDIQLNHPKLAAYIESNLNVIKKNEHFVILKW